MKKRKMFIYLFLLFVMLVPSKTKASSCDEDYSYSCASCVYKYKLSEGPTITFKMTAFEEKNGTISLGDDWKKIQSTTFGIKYDFEDVEGTSDIGSAASYYSSDRTQLTCNPKLYVYSKCTPTQSGMASATGTKNCKIKISYSKKEDYDEVTVEHYLNKKKLQSANSSSNSNTGSSNNGKTTTCKVEATLINGSTLQDTGEKVQLTFNIASGTIVSNSSDYHVSFRGLEASDFDDKCKTDKKIYAYCTTAENTTNNGANSFAGTVNANCKISDETNKDNYSKETSISYIPTGGENGGDDLLRDDTNEQENSDDMSLETCEEIMGDMADLIGDIYKMIEILAPILLIVFGCIDFGGAVVQNDNDALKKATNNFIKRTIATAAIFLLPFIVSLILSLPGIETGLEDVMCGLGKVIIKW